MPTNEDTRKQNKSNQMPDAATSGARPVDPLLIEKLFPDPLQSLKPGRTSPQLKDNCVFVLDTSVLLSPYDVGHEGLIDIGMILKKLSSQKRLFFPAQALREFIRNRPDKLAEVYSRIRERLRIQLPDLAPRHLMFEDRPEYRGLVAAAQKVDGAITEYREKVEAALIAMRDWSSSDPVSALYHELATPTTVVEHGMAEDKIKNDLNWRVANTVPPGWADKGKSGDLLVWYTVLRIGKERQTDVVLVTNEKKPDWMATSKDDRESGLFSESLFARSELIDEFLRVTGGKQFAAWSLARLLQIMEAKQATVEQIKAITHKKEREELIAQYNTILHDLYNDVVFPAALHCSERTIDESQLRELLGRLQPLRDEPLGKQQLEYLDNLLQTGYILGVWAAGRYPTKGTDDEKRHANEMYVAWLNNLVRILQDRKPLNLPPTR